MPDGDTMDTGENADIQPKAGLPNAGAHQAEDPPEDVAPINEHDENERELSQTDHLNKSLLTSFLARLNDPSSAFASVMMGQGSTPGMQQPQIPSLHQQGQVDSNGAASRYQGDGEMEEGNHGNTGEDAASPWLPDDRNENSISLVEK